jgi:gamma-glutamyltranspeptidase / glutathione hydrolase
MNTARLLVLLSIVGCSSESTTHPVEPNPMPESRSALVVSYNADARAAAQRVLAEGGSAADAFVAATLVEYVIAPGVTSLAGPLGAMHYDATERRVEWLDAGFDSVNAADGLYDPNAPELGKSVLIPGALRGLHALWKKGGRLAWARLVEPAHELADQGFVIDSMYASAIAWRSDVLERTEYGKSTFLPNGLPLTAGTKLRQPALAELLVEIAEQGADAIYGGAWAGDFAELVNQHGGRASVDDLARYEARWLEPHWSHYRGFDLAACSGRTYGGLFSMVALEALEHDPRDPRELAEVDRLELGLRTARTIYESPWFYSAQALDDPNTVAWQLSESASSALWTRIASGLAAKPDARGGSHSYHVTVIDADGNIVTGTNTINSMPWGTGLFVRGVPLTDAGSVTYFVPGPGQRVVSPFSVHIALEAGEPVFAGGAFGSSLLEAQLQLVLGVLGERLTASEVATRKRFGTFPFDFDHPENGVDVSKNWLDPSVPASVASELESRGLQVVQDARSDLGFAAFVVRDQQQAWHGATFDAPFFQGGVTRVER